MGGVLATFLISFLASIPIESAVPILRSSEFFPRNIIVSSSYFLSCLLHLAMECPFCRVNHTPPALSSSPRWPRIALVASSWSGRAAARAARIRPRTAFRGSALPIRSQWNYSVSRWSEDTLGKALSKSSRILGLWRRSHSASNVESTRARMPHSSRCTAFTLPHGWHSSSWRRLCLANALRWL